jgi:hypothetical protein
VSAWRCPATLRVVVRQEAWFDTERTEEIRALVENTPDISARVDRQLRHRYVQLRVVSGKNKGTAVTATFLLEPRIDATL